MLLEMNSPLIRNFQLFVVNFRFVERENFHFDSKIFRYSVHIFQLDLVNLQFQLCK